VSCATATATALAIRPVSAPVAPFGLLLDLVLLDHALVRLEHGHAGDRELDAMVYEALGWEVERMPISRRRISWRARSRLSTAWQTLPAPTADLAAAASTVPHGWDWRVGTRDGAPIGFVQERRLRRGADLPAFFEANRLTPERALLSAILFAHRFIARGGAYG
jgi:hypothetical protein